MFAILAFGTLLCGCAVEKRPTVDQRSKEEIRGLLNKLVLHGTSSSDASNALLNAKHVAIPLLLESVFTLDYDDQRQLDSVAEACRILGTNAHPVLREVLKSLPSEDPARQGGTFFILIGAGASSFGPMIDFLRSATNFSEGYSVNRAILAIVEDSPKEGVTELIRLYRVSGKAADIKALITSTFQEALTKEDCPVILPILKPLLREGDPFIAIVALDYIKRCGASATGVIHEVNNLLRSSNPQVRSAASNTIQLITRNN